MAFILEHIIDFCASVESALSVGCDSPAHYGACSVWGSGHGAVQVDLEEPLSNVLY